MPKLNQYYIKNIEKLPKTEQIVYLDQNYQPQSYEEFMKTYEPNEEVEIITETEWQDRVLHGSQFGPGNETSKEVFKVVGKTVISVGAAGAVLATGGAAAPVVLGGVAAAAGGKLAKETGKELDCEFLEWIGDTTCDTGVNLLTGSLAGATSSVPNNLARHIATATNRGGPVVAKLMRAAKEGYDTVSGITGNCEDTARFYHAFHRDDGVSYKSDCPVCKGTY